MVVTIENLEETGKGTKKKISTTFIVNLERTWEIQHVLYEAGVLPALFDAIFIAKKEGRPLPDWAVDGALNVIGDRLKVGFTKGKGATGNELAKYQMDMKHYHRWQAVKKLKREGIPWSEVYIKALKILKGTAASVGPKGPISDETVKKSYGRVQKDMKDPKKALLYYQCLYEAMELTGIDPGVCGVTIRSISVP